MGRGPAGAEALLVIASSDVPIGEVVIAEGTDGTIVRTVDVGFSELPIVLLPPTGYILILWTFSTSVPDEDIVEVPVVPEFGDCCLENNNGITCCLIYYSSITDYSDYFSIY